MSELTAALATIEKCREITNCPAGVDLQDHLRKLVADNEKAMDSLRQADAAVKLAHEKFSAIAAENVGLKEYRPEPCGIAMMEALDSFFADEEVPERAMMAAFEILCAKRMPTPATNAAIAGIKADGVEEFANKRGFSFQHGSIHAHFGNGDVLVGATKYENGHAGICFAPVREKDGGVGTEYKWTEGKNTNEVGAVFVISSSSVAGLEVIQSKLSEAIELLREGADK